MIVVDASAMVDVLLRGEVLDDELHAPDAMTVETFSALRRMSLAGVVEPSRARECVSDLTRLAVTRHDTRRHLPRMWAMRHDIAAYDAAYVALAEALGAPLVTLDRRLASVAQRYCDVAAV